MEKIESKLEEGGTDDFLETFEDLRNTLAEATEAFIVGLTEELNELSGDTLPLWQFAWSCIPTPNKNTPVYPWIDVSLLSSTKAKLLL